MGDTINLFDGIIGDFQIADKVKSIQTDYVSVKQLHEFKNHPFKVRKDNNYAALNESIKKYGIIEPIIARRRKQGTGYEIISGHRRWNVAQDLKLESVPVKIIDVDDNMAVIMMVDSNKKRDKYLPSELAFAFKQRLDAEEKYTRDNGGGRVTERIGKDFGMSPRNVSNYIKLTSLIPDLLDLVDSNVLKKNAAMLLADMPEDRQSMIYDEYAKSNYIPSKEALIEIAAYDEWDMDDYRNACNNESSKKKSGLLSEFDEYFPDDWGKKEKIELITELLEGWSKSNKGVQL